MTLDERLKRRWGEKTYNYHINKSKEEKQPQPIINPSASAPAERITLDERLKRRFGEKTYNYHINKSKEIKQPQPVNKYVPIDALRKKVGDKVVNYHLKKAEVAGQKQQKTLPVIQKTILPNNVKKNQVNTIIRNNVTRTNNSLDFLKHPQTQTTYTMNNARVIQGQLPQQNQKIQKQGLTQQSINRAQQQRPNQQTSQTEKLYTQQKPYQPAAQRIQHQTQLSPSQKVQQTSQKIYQPNQLAAQRIQPFNPQKSSTAYSTKDTSIRLSKSTYTTKNETTMQNSQQKAQQPQFFKKFSNKKQIT